MGQQQLLLIVLGVILVGVAVVLGIQYFGVGAEEGAKDELVAHSQIIASNAQEWYKKPESMGGGGLKFTGFDDKFFALHPDLAASTNGDYSITVNPQLLQIQGTPNTNLGYNWTVDTRVTADTVNVQITPTGQ